MAAFKLLTILATLGVAYSQNPAAPVLIWGNHHSIDKMTSKMGEINANTVEDYITKSDFEDGKDTHVLIGILESLSFPDLFVKYGEENAFSNVQKMMDKSKYKNFFTQTSSSAKKSPDTTNNTFPDVQNLIESNDHRQRVNVIKITPKGEDLTETLKMADNIMHKACEEHAFQYKSYICVMTALSGGQEGEHIRIARSLLQTAPAEETDLSQDVYYLTDFALLYIKPMPLLQFTKTTPPVDYNLTKTSGPITKQDKTLSIKFQVKNDVSKTYLVGFIFESTSSSWSLVNVSCCEGKTTDFILTPSISISASLGYSFHTPSKVVFKNDTGGIILTLNSLQVEYSTNLPTMRFGVAEDTVYFFTIPILSGLFVTSLLVTIVLLGLSMIFDIKTMDLFDDPKGKTVTINASE